MQFSAKHICIISTISKINCMEMLIHVQSPTLRIEAIQNRRTETRAACPHLFDDVVPAPDLRAVGVHEGGLAVCAAVVVSR